MKTIRTLILATAAVFATQQAGWAQQTQLQLNAANAAGNAYSTWRSVRGALPSSNYTQQTSDYTYRTYLKALYTYYGINIRPGGSNPMTSYDRMWAWADVARDADYAYDWLVAGLERGYVPWNSNSQRALTAIWQAKVAAEAASDEAFDDFYDSYYFF